MRKDQELKKEYQKDVEFEQILSLMNSKLFEAEDELIEELKETFPTVHILGVPRAGTTLAVQLLAENFDIGYINNLIAAFWKAPLFGIALSEQLLNSTYKSTLKSKFGRTDNIQEPHEFGYFWNYHLKYDNFLQKDVDHEEEINWGQFSTLLKNICRAFDKPVLFKSFLFGFHAKKAVQKLNKTCFIYIQRDLIDNAMSILNMRRNYMGDVNKWASIKPKQYRYLKKQDYYTQIVGQILFLEYEYFNQLEQIPESNRLVVQYEDLCSQTNNIFNDINKLIDHHTERLSVTDNYESQKLKINKYSRTSPEAKKILKSQEFLSAEFPELTDLIEKRKKRFN